MTSNHTLDLERLRLSQDFPNKVGVKKAIITVPVRKPDRQWFVRVHADEAWRLETAVLELRDEREERRTARRSFARCFGVVVYGFLERA